MEVSREIYWNVGTGVMIPMYLILFATFGAIFYMIKDRVALYKKGLPKDRFDQRNIRIKNVLKKVFFQSKVLKVPGPGRGHAIFFWGFILLFIGTLIIMLQADVLKPLFGINILQGTFYKFYSQTHRISYL